MSMNFYEIWNDEMIVDYTILRQAFDMAREGGDDWVEDRFYKGKKIE